ncbi:MAG: cobyric acid synthase [Hyphomicrobiales bacterium]|nr:cobyric acid synthase [Hyphomicrobiales bacterium]
MIQGTGSNVGKSLLVAGLCRLFARRGLAVRPFKPQNMSNNAAATPDGGEIGRAQALQAQAAGAPLSVHMNPVLLKPEADAQSQIIVQGKRFGRLASREFGKRKPELLPRILESFDRLSAEADLVVIEGAGSPAEVNLRAGDIANMGFAEAADVPVILAGDIDRGGVIASIVGTHCLISETERKRIKAFLINKFRGDVSLFAEGEKLIAERTGWASAGVLPYFPAASRLPAEDAVDIRITAANGPHERAFKIAVPVISRIANFDDLDPLRLEPGVAIDFVEPGRPLPRDADLIFLPGSKSTIEDLKGICAEGWDIDIAAHLRAGGHVVGICGGYQMLGHAISDPDGIEGRAGRYPGLGLLDIKTILTADKQVRQVSGTEIASGQNVTGYEIHLGQTSGIATQRPWLDLGGRRDGAISPDSRVMGSYVHGLFQSDAFRRAFLGRLGANAASGLNFTATVETTLDQLADHLQAHLDIAKIQDIAQSRNSIGPKSWGRISDRNAF